MEELLLNYGVTILFYLYTMSKNEDFESIYDIQMKILL